LLAAGLWPASPSTAATSPSTTAAADALAGSLRQRALEAYSRRDFASAVEALNELVAAAPGEARWLEMRAMALVDGKNFVDATVDFDACLAALGRGPSLDRARVLSGRGLAWEGLGDWVAALDDYTAALAEAAAVGKGADAYIVNARGNCHASLGEWGAARADYLESARLFQTARRQEGSMQMRLDGAVFAFSNAALMLAQLGDDEGALREFRAMERRAPGSADMRAALAALYWGRGEAGRAEEAWEFACDNITVGCAK
jgi:tetratricopeptide (TPR) repeat protein